MSRQKNHHTKQFKLDAINYRKEHPDLTQVECAKNLYASVSVPLLAGRPNSEITTVIFPLSAPVITLLKKRRKSLVLSVNSVMLRMHLMW